MKDDYKPVSRVIMSLHQHAQQNFSHTLEAQQISALHGSDATGFCREELEPLTDLEDDDPVDGILRRSKRLSHATSILKRQKETPAWPLQENLSSLSSFNPTFTESANPRGTKRRRVPLENLTNLSAKLDNTTNAGSDQCSNTWSATSRISLSSLEEKERRKRQRIEKNQTQGKDVAVYFSTFWQLEDGLRSSSGYKGRPGFVLKDVPVLPEESSPSAWIKILEEADYEFREVK